MLAYEKIILKKIFSACTVFSARNFSIKSEKNIVLVIDIIITIDILFNLLFTTLNKILTLTTHVYLKQSRKKPIAFSRIKFIKKKKKLSNYVT